MRNATTIVKLIKSLSLTVVFCTGLSMVEAQSVNLRGEPPALFGNAACISATLPNVNAAPGSTISIPVTVGDTTALGITTYLLALDFDAAIIRPSAVSFDTAGTLSSSFTVSPSTDVPGSLFISAVGIAPLAGQGTLLKLKFDVKGAPQQSSDLTWSIVYFNGGQPCATNPNGKVTITSSSPTPTPTPTPGPTATPTPSPTPTPTPSPTPFTGRRAAADFDGDGKSDVSVFRETEGNWYFINSSSNTPGAVHFGGVGDRIVPGDYDGDRKTDCAVFRQSDGTWYLFLSTGVFTGIKFGASDDIPAQGDFDGDGKTDLAVFRPSTGVWFIQSSKTGAVSATQFGQAGDQPVPGDYDGDGKTDVAVFRPSEGNWYLLRSTAGFVGIHFGLSTDKAAPADFDGDGKTDPAVYRDGTWYLFQSTAGFTGVPFGISTDIAAPADFDGDGKADISVFRPSSGVWFIQRSSGGIIFPQFGQNGDKPVPSGYVPTPVPTPGPALTEEQRMAAVDAVNAMFESLSVNPDKNAVNQALLDFIRGRPEFADAGISDDSCVSATFTDGVEFIVVNNRNPSEAPNSAAQPESGISDSTHLSPDNLPSSVTARMLFTLPPAGFTNAIPKIRPWLETENYIQPVNEGSDLSALRKVGGDGVFYIAGHGATNKAQTLYAVSIATQVTVTLNDDVSIKDDLAKGRLVILDGPNATKPVGGFSASATYGFTSKFIRQYWGNFSKNSFFFNDSCSGGGAAAADFRAALKEKGLSVYAGWTLPIGDQAETARFVFDRLLGANKIYSENDGYKQRPFDYQSVLQDLPNHVPQEAAKLTFIPLAAVPNSEGFKILAPSIWRMSVFEYNTPNQLQILGIFSDDPGEANRAVYVDGKKLDNCLWSNIELDCDLPVSGAGSSGEVTVFVNFQRSNPAHLTEWEGDFIHTVRPTTVPAGDEQQADTYHVRFRADIRHARLAIHRPPTFLLPGENGRTFFAAEDSLFTYQNTGSFTTLDAQGKPVCTETWSGHDSFKRGPLTPSPGSRSFKFLGFFTDDNKASAQLSVSALGLFKNTVCVNGGGGSDNAKLISPKTSDGDPDTFNLSAGLDYNFVGSITPFTDVLQNVHTLSWNLRVKAGTIPNPDSPR